MKAQFKLRKSHSIPEMFILIIPRHGAHPELQLGPFGEVVTKEELRKFGLNEPGIGRMIETARREFETLTRHTESQNRG